MSLKRVLSILITVLIVFTVSYIYAYSEESQPIATVKEYLNAPSQYTNGSAYGININGTLNGTLCSLGNFGGYVVYEFNDPILNSDKHLYGVDFAITGNAFSASNSTQEPGQVWVSQNGVDWYALAGSEHYEDETVWDYSITYKYAEEKKCSYTDSLGDSGIVSPASYPVQENYPTVVIPEDEITFNGVLLRKQRTASTSNGIYTSFGYVDTLIKSNTKTAVNPYLENPSKNCSDGMFDISWAVDKNGYCVNLDWIKYVKVQTATFIDGGVFGEKSTEISSLYLIDEETEPVNDGSSKISISVNGESIPLVDGKNCYYVDAEGEFDVTVEGDSNVYINNSYGSTRHFDAQTDKGIIRVIVQSGNGEPEIYYLTTANTKDKTELSISETSLTIGVGETKTISASADNSESITWSSTDESVAVVDENGLITAKSAGNADIIATSESGANIKCSVTVVSNTQNDSIWLKIWRWIVKVFYFLFGWIF